MVIGLIDLSLLIELLISEIYRLNDIIDSPDSSEEMINNAGDSLTSAVRAFGSLHEAYVAQWQEGSNMPCYEELIKSIEDRLS